MSRYSHNIPHTATKSPLAGSPILARCQLANATEPTTYYPSAFHVRGAALVGLIVSLVSCLGHTSIVRSAPMFVLLRSVASVFAREGAVALPDLRVAQPAVRA